MNSLNGGVHSLTATYSGNVDFTTANSSLSQRVPDCTLAANPTDVTIHRGQSATIDITGTPLAGFTGQVSITCNNLPQYASCAFNPATTTINGQATVTVLTFNTKAASHDASAQKFSAFQLASWMLALPGFMGVMFIRAGRGRRKQLSLLCCAIAFVALSSWACGGSPGSSNPPPGQNSTVAPGSYSATVSANVVGEAAHSRCISL